MLVSAAVNLQKEHPGWKFVIYDATRPHSAQAAISAAVGNPSNAPSSSCYGAGIELGLKDDKGNIVPMGGDFDQKAGAEFDPSKKTPEQANRAILRNAMTSAGFKAYDKEWWHFIGASSSTAKSDPRFKLVE